MISPATRAFIAAHRNDDVRSLALKAKEEKGVDLREALVQIESRQLMSKKAPHLTSVEGILYPERLATEQCSSESTAAYKVELIKRLVGKTGSMIDLTGGFGIDFAALSQLFKKATYIERNENLCSLARNNFHLLGIENAEIICADAEDFLSDAAPVDLIFLDPARRTSKGQKAVTIADCTPNVAELYDLLATKCRYLMIKLSPMLDINAALKTLLHCREIHVIAVDDEVKELLAFVDFSFSGEVKICCCDLRGEKRDYFEFFPQQEINAKCVFADETKNFIYEPDATLMKAGAFRLISQHFGLKKLHPNTHLYTSATKIPYFIGRVFQIDSVCGFSKDELRSLTEKISRANVAVRNFPTSAEELRKRLKLKDGGDIYLFGTTISDSNRHIIISCHRVKYS